MRGRRFDFPFRISYFVFRTYRGQQSHCGIVIVCPTFSVSAFSPGLAAAIFFHWLPSPYWSLAILKSVSWSRTVYDLAPALAAAAPPFGVVLPAVAPAAPLVLRDVPFASACCTGGVFVCGGGSVNAGTCCAGGGVYGAGGV